MQDSGGSVQNEGSSASNSERDSSGGCSSGSNASSRGSVAQESSAQSPPIQIPIQILHQHSTDPLAPTTPASHSPATPDRAENLSALKRNLLGVGQEDDAGGGENSSSVANGTCAANGSLAQGPSSSSVFKKRDFSSTDREIIRLIGQHLRDLGLHTTVETLVSESQCELEYPVASRFRENVLSGRWEKVPLHAKDHRCSRLEYAWPKIPGFFSSLSVQIDHDLRNLRKCIESPEKLTEMKFLLLEQQYLELLEKGDVVDALKVLREKLSPLKFSTERLHQLSSFLMYNNGQELRAAAKWDGEGDASRQKLMNKLQSFLPPSVMLPPRRLEQLLRQAVELQRRDCFYHNTQQNPELDTEALLSGHACDKNSFPCRTDQILNEHGDEVWFCQFNNAGTLLATGSKEPTLFVWELDQRTGRFRKKWSLDGHTFGAAFFAWSPDDKFLAVTGTEDCSELWIWNTEVGELRHKMVHSQEDSLSCVAWSPNSQNFVCGGTKGQFYYCDLDGNVLNSFEGVRIRSVHFKRDGHTVLAADSHSRIRAYTFMPEVHDQHLIKEEHNIMNFTLDSTERYALVGLVSQGVHLWDVEDKCLVRRFRGVTQGFYNIFSCFGGLNQDYIASGSEDNNVYVWHRERENPVVSLPGHTGVVNAVAWNPSDPSMLASASDDGTVRIWRPSRPSAHRLLQHQRRHGSQHTPVIDSVDSCEVSSTTTNQK